MSDGGIRIKQNQIFQEFCSFLYDVCFTKSPRDLVFSNLQGSKDPWALLTPVTDSWHLLEGWGAAQQATRISDVGTCADSWSATVKFQMKLETYFSAVDVSFICSCEELGLGHFKQCNTCRMMQYVDS